MIKLQDIAIAVNNKMILKNVNLDIKAGSIIRFSGANGVGKSSLLEVILKFNRPSMGSIIYENPIDEFGYLPQVSHQFPKIFLQLKDICPVSFSFYPKHLLEKSWHTSSGGERKKALIARTIFGSKDLLVLDEPFNHLDEKSSIQVSEELIELSKKGMTILYTGHEHKIEGSIDYEVEQWML